MIATATDAIERFLSDHQSAPWYSPGLDTQILPREISDDERDEMPDEWATRQFYSHRFAGGTPPYPLTYAARIGTTGYNVEKGVAEFATFEFDSGHSIDNSESDLQRIDDALAGLCDVRKSTGGKGRHCRVCFAESVPVKDRAEYTALCRYVLAQLSQQIGIDLAKHVCGVGCILWLYTDTPKPESFEPVAEQSEPFTVPDGWEPPPRIGSVGDKVTTADAEHQRIFDWMQSEGWIVRPHTLDDGVCYALHTAGLKAAHEALNLRGTFDTISPGRDRATPNCYAFLKDGGGLHVFRFGSVAEPSWNKRKSDGRSWCWFNQFAAEDWEQLCSRFRGVATYRKDAWRLQSYDDAAAVVRAAGGTFPAPNLSDRPVTLLLIAGRIIAQVDRHKDEIVAPPWVEMSSKTFACNIEIPAPILDRSPSSVIRHVRVGYHWNDSGRQDGQTLYYVRHADTGVWKLETKDNGFAALGSDDLPG